MDEQTEDCLLIAIEEVGYLERILKELLDFAKPEELKLIRCSINDIVGIALSNVKVTLQREEVTILKKLSDSLPPINLDPDQLTKAIGNVMLNASQAVGEKGVIEVSSRLCSRGKEVCLTISDNGCGMDEETLDNIYTPFYSKKSEGTGLGMTVVEKVINGHNGNVDIHSKKGQGTTVRLFLPVKDT